MTFKVLQTLISKDNKKTARQLAEDNRWQEIADPEVIENACKRVIAANKKKV